MPNELESVSPPESVPACENANNQGGEGRAPANGYAALSADIAALYAEACDESKWPTRRKRSVRWCVHQSAVIHTLLKVRQRIDYYQEAPHTAPMSRPDAARRNNTDT